MSAIVGLLILVAATCRAVIAPQMFPVDLLIVYFVYGLAFFSMGLALILESGRAPLLAEARELRPLAVFGILHGIHEWLDLLFLEFQWLQIQSPAYLYWLRLGILALSFISLLAYGIQVLRPPKHLANMDVWVGGGLLLLYSAIVVFLGAFWGTDLRYWILVADILARYLLAVPGALLAGLALFRQAQRARVEQRELLVNTLKWAAWGFLFYGGSQIFVAQANFLLAQYVNAEMFMQLTGFPVQILRAGMALLIMYSLIRSTQIVERERQQQLVHAQEARLEALQRVQEELVKREALRRELLRHTVVAQEDERARIARELHDETAQALTAFSLDLATLRSLLPEQPKVREVVERLQTLSRQMSERLYRLVHDLRPAQLDDLGLVPALQHLVSVAPKNLGLTVDFQVRGEKIRLDSLVETVFFRTIQEALTNIARHAQTDSASVCLCYDPEQTTVRIIDQGVGFDPEAVAASRKGWGLAGIRERARSVGAQLQVISSPDNGTSIELIVPLTIPKTSRNEEIDYATHSNTAR